jgi:hypothetical protein
MKKEIKVICVCWDFDILVSRVQYTAFGETEEEAKAELVRIMLEAGAANKDRTIMTEEDILRNLKVI